MVGLREEEKARKNAEAGPPVYDDLIKRNFTTGAPNQLWLGQWRRCLHRAVWGLFQSRREVRLMFHVEDSSRH